METSIKSVVLKLNTDKPVRKTPYQVKGVFIRHFKNELIVPWQNIAKTKSNQASAA